MDKRIIIIIHMGKRGMIIILTTTIKETTITMIIMEIMDITALTQIIIILTKTTTKIMINTIIMDIIIQIIVDIKDQLLN